MASGAGDPVATGQDRVAITPAAAAVLRELIAEHGPLLFHQSGGCCDGSAPMCYPRGEFIVGQRDVHLGDVESTPVYIGAARPAVPDALGRLRDARVTGYARGLGHRMLRRPPGAARGG